MPQQKQYELDSILTNESSLREALPPLTPEIRLQDDVPYFSSPIFVSSVMLFFVSVLVFVLMSNLIKSNKEPGEILKTFGVPLIIVAAVFVVITGVDINKLTPVIGLLGTIAGYLLGRSEKKFEEENQVLQTKQATKEQPKEQLKGQSNNQTDSTPSSP